MSQGSSPRIWAILGIGLAVVTSLGLLLVFLGHEPGEPDPMIAPVTRPSTEGPSVATIDGRPIQHADWMEAVLLDHVMSGLSGKPAPPPEGTLHRLINEELVLNALPAEEEPTGDQIEARIAALEQAWGVDDAAVVTALEGARLTRATFERAVGRLLTVEAGLETLEGQGYDTAEWLEEQRASVDIVINDKLTDVSVPYVPIADPTESPIPTPAVETACLSPALTPRPETTDLSPIPTPVPETPSPVPTPVTPDIAPDFTLEQVGGGTFTLSEQLEQGAVVLAFFHRHG
jgi:hypothetical protein